MAGLVVDMFGAPMFFPIAAVATGLAMVVALAMLAFHTYRAGERYGPLCASSGDVASSPAAAAG
ncbi:MAG TPA: hypothetical protein VF163_12300 [Micromonosporaceae bacterium]